jgi:hypothetical protein
VPRECGPEASKKAHALGLRRIGHVEDLDPGRLQADRLRLVGDHQEIAGHVERVRAHVAVRQVGLEDHRGLARIADVQRGQVLGCGLVREPQHALAVARELDDHALADVAEAVELVLREQAHVHGDPPGGIVAPWRRLTTPARTSNREQPPTREAAPS